MGSDTLPGTPGNQRAVQLVEVKSALSFWKRADPIWETNAPEAGNGVYWLWYNADGDAELNTPPAPYQNEASTFYYTFINPGSAYLNAVVAGGIDNTGYIVLNGVKYPSINTNMARGREGFGTNITPFTVTIPTGLNTLEVRAMNGVSLTVWDWIGAVGQNNPAGMWLTITSSTGTILIKTTEKWQCTAFNYPAKFILPISLGDVAENAGLSRPYSMAALAGKRIYDNSMNATTLSLPLSLVATNFKTFASTTSNPLIYLQLFTNTNDTGSAASEVTTFGPVSFTTIAGKQCVYINNSANTYISLNYISSMRFTIAFWVYLIDTGDYTSSAIANVELTNSVLQFDFRYGEFQIPTALPNNPMSASAWTLFPGISGATAGTWHFVAVSINQTNYEANYYLNGVLRVTRTGTGPLPLRAKIIIGRSGDNTRPFNGYIRKYYFFTSILSPSSINELYSQG
jgi:hypothetical protein